jgi:hypothetical protein
MPLIDLKTNLKDLKYGKDQYRGGDSGQPFIPTRIPSTNEPLQTSVSISGPDIVQTIGSTLLATGAGAAIGALGGSVLGATGAGALIGSAVGLGIGLASNIDQGNSISIKPPSAGTGGPDFLLRGGSLVANYVIDDFNRLSKFFKNNNGTLFTIKQNLLSRLGTRAQGAPILLNERLYAPLSTILGAVGSPFGLHVNKQGLNPFQGIGEIYTPDRYFDAIRNSNSNIQNDLESLEPLASNRLFSLYWVKILDNQSNPLTTNVGVASKADDTLIISYPGGPNTFLGIGKTNIKYATDIFGAPLKVKDASNYYDNTLTYNQLIESAEETNAGIPNYIKQIDFRDKLREGAISPSYNPSRLKTLETRTNLGDPGNYFGGQKRTVNYYYGYGGDINNSYGAASPYSYDKINALPIYRYNSNQTNPDVPSPDTYSDLVNFRIGVISNDNISNQTNNVDYIHFRAFLDKITDSYKADWKEIKYVGRGESFYSYSGFDRKVSLSWTVAAQSKVELIPMYKKLNYLASLCAPDYSEYGYMRGNIVKLTIGGYFHEQPGIITGFNYDMNEDNDSWEIGIDYKGDVDNSVRQLPHIIRVSGFDFIPIHEFVPRKQQLKFAGISGSDPGVVSVYGKERFIALKGENQESLYETVVNTNDDDSEIFDPMQQDTTLYNRFSTGLLTAEDIEAKLEEERKRKKLEKDIKFQPPKYDGSYLGDELPRLPDGFPDINKLETLPDSVFGTFG